MKDYMDGDMGEVREVREVRGMVAMQLVLSRVTHATTTATRKGGVKGT